MIINNTPVLPTSYPENREIRSADVIEHMQHSFDMSICSEQVVFFQRSCWIRATSQDIIVAPGCRRIDGFFGVQITGASVDVNITITLFNDSSNVVGSTAFSLLAGSGNGGFSITDRDSDFYSLRIITNSSDTEAGTITAAWSRTGTRLGYYSYDQDTHAAGLPLSYLSVFHHYRRCRATIDEWQPVFFHKGDGDHQPGPTWVPGSIGGTGIKRHKIRVLLHGAAEARLIYRTFAGTWISATVGDGLAVMLETFYSVYIIYQLGDITVDYWSVLARRATQHEISQPPFTLNGDPILQAWPKMDFLPPKMPVAGSVFDQFLTSATPSYSINAFQIQKIDKVNVCAWGVGDIEQMSMSVVYMGLPAESYDLPEGPTHEPPLMDSLANPTQLYFWLIDVIIDLPDQYHDRTIGVQTVTVTLDPTPEGEDIPILINGIGVTK